MKAILRKNPELDFFYGIMNGLQIPTKQDKFKPFHNIDLYEKQGGKFEKIDSSDLYQKKEMKPTHKDFEAKLKTNLKKEVKDKPEFPIQSPQKVEVILNIQMTQKRLNCVDIDNLTKSVLDCLSGIIFDDDSQVTHILASKNVNSISSKNGFMLGVRKIKEDGSDSWFKNVNLAYFDYIEDNKNLYN